MESAGGLGYLLSQQLVAAGETVLDVPATLAARVRVLGTGRSDKNDPNDARSVAIAALRAPALAEVRAEDHVSVLRLLAKRHRDLGRARNRTACRLHAIIAELVAGGIDKELVTTQVRALIDGLEATTATQAARLEIAAELTDDLARLDAQIKASKRRLADAVDRVGLVVDRHLRDRPGAGRDDHRLHRRPHPVPQPRRLRQLQRHRPDRPVLGPPRHPPAVATREPPTEPRHPHGRGHPDPLRAQPRPRLLRRQARRRARPRRKPSER